MLAESQPIPTEHGEVTTRLSLGVADNAATASLDRLLSRADGALYEAKRGDVGGPPWPGAHRPRLSRSTRITPTN